MPVEAFESTGTDNLIFRLGDDMLVRVPREPRTGPMIGREYRALSEFQGLPLEAPRPLAIDDGEAWAIYRWIDGATPLAGQVANNMAAAGGLGRFVAALRRQPSGHGLQAGKINAYRGTDLGGRDAVVRWAIAELEGAIDTATATRIWHNVQEIPAYRGPARWLHGDLHPGNLIVHGSALVGVIDWGLSALGDPAADLAAAWMVFDADARPAFLKTAGMEADAWARGRGWALYQGLIALAGSRDTNPVLAAIGRDAIERVLADPP